MNRIEELFNSGKKNILSVFFTAGHPSVDSTSDIIKSLEKAGADMIEAGIPFSDPLADGPVIQKSSSAALKNGMNLNLLFRQLEGLRTSVKVPVLLMGYLNPVLKFGMEKFCRKCAETGIDGVILPDLPPEIYTVNFRKVFRKYGLMNVLLISPRTDNERARFIDSITEGFIYMVSSSSVTGMKKQFTGPQLEYFRRINNLRLNHPVMIGFGISSGETFAGACRFARGAIVGSAFIEMLEEKGFDPENVEFFVKSIKGKTIP